MVFVGVQAETDIIGGLLAPMDSKLYFAMSPAPTLPDWLQSVRQVMRRRAIVEANRLSRRCRSTRAGRPGPKIDSYGSYGQRPESAHPRPPTETSSGRAGLDSSPSCWQRRRGGRDDDRDALHAFPGRVASTFNWSLDALQLVIESTSPVSGLVMRLPRRSSRDVVRAKTAGR
jgi:hypothetical protein